MFSEPDHLKLSLHFPISRTSTGTICHCYKLLSANLDQFKRSAKPTVECKMAQISCGISSMGWKISYHWGSNLRTQQWLCSVERLPSYCYFSSKAILQPKADKNLVPPIRAVGVNNIFGFGALKTCSTVRQEFIEPFFEFLCCFLLLHPCSLKFPACSDKLFVTHECCMEFLILLQWWQCSSSKCVYQTKACVSFHLSCIFLINTEHL